MKESMSKDRSERKTYHKSPGRQYGYDYDPLRGRNGQNGQGQEEQATQAERSQRISTQLSQRPDPRRTRQLTRKSIIASKGRAATEVEVPDEEFTEEEVYETSTRRPSDEEQEDPTYYSHRRQARSGNLLPSTRQLMETDEEAVYGEEVEDGYDDEWQDDQDYQDDVDSEVYGDSDPLAMRVVPAPRVRALAPQLAPRRQIVEPDEYEDDEYDDDYEEEQPERRRRRKKKVSRRGVLFGLGAAVVGGAGIAAYKLGPEIPGAVNGATSNLEHQVEDAFNKGLAEGANNARKALLTELQNLEGFTLEGAVSAAKLTRMAYDVFVSPIVKVGSVITGDFLGTMLKAVTTARGWLKNAYLDNGTLEAVQTVLQSWVNQVSSLPQQLDAITNTDLDGAQSYLRALEAKIKDEQAKMNQNGTPTAAPPQKTK